MKPDRGYEPYRKKAKALGYLWGSFYIGISSVGPRTQARFYLDNAKPTDDEVMALDLEDISKEEYMNLDQAVIFINYIKNATGRYPIVYVTGSVHDAIFNKFGKNSVFSKVPLWYARNTDEITPYFAISPWQTYTLWQFSSEINCCKTVRGKTVCDPPTSCCPFGIDPSVPKISGINIDMDVNVFYGTKEELRKAWPFTFKDNR